MAVAANKNKYAYAPSRVYSYSRAAVAEALPAYEPEYEPKQTPRPAVKAHPGAKTRVRREPSAATKRKQRFMPKFMSVSAVFIMAAMLIYIIVRYTMITAEWADVNAMQAKIDESRRRITQLEVQLDAAADLVAARDTALGAGLNYPTADQIVNVEGSVSGGD